MNILTIFQNMKNALMVFLEFVRYNFLLLFLTTFFSYRTFLVGRLNYALLLLLLAFLLMIVCQVVIRFIQHPVVKYFYRALIIFVTGILVFAVCIQLGRFGYTFTTTFTEPTLAKILVRLGVVTVSLYLIALIITFVYYLFVHKMIEVVWFGSITPILRNSSSKSQDNNWRRERISSLIFIHTLFWGGFASIVTLGLGFLAWLLR